jgi:hypothetical protein
MGVMIWILNVTQNSCVEDLVPSAAMSKGKPFGRWVDHHGSDLMIDEWLDRSMGGGGNSRGWGLGRSLAAHPSCSLSLSLFLPVSWPPWGEQLWFPTSPPTMMLGLITNPETMEPRDHGVQLLKPYDKINLSSCKLVFSSTLLYNGNVTNTVGDWRCRKQSHRWEGLLCTRVSCLNRIKWPCH